MIKASAETLKEAARRLSNSAIKEGFVPNALHEYTLEDGTSLFWKIRLKDAAGNKWIRPMFMSNGEFRLGEPACDGKKPLYRICSIINSDESLPVYVVEGESAADSLEKIGLISTTSGGATSASSVCWAPLYDREIIIWPDSDDPGLDYAAEVADLLKGKAKKISIVDISLLGLPEHGDAFDWLTLHKKSMTQPNVEEITTIELPGRLQTRKEVSPAQIKGTEGNTETQFFVNSDGVHFKGPNEDVLVCGPLFIKAKTRDLENGSWGRLLEWRDDDGNQHEWVMPMDLLEGDSIELRRELSRRGMYFPPSKKPYERNLLQTYIKQFQQTKRLRLVTQTGWHNQQYVTNSKTFGDGSEELALYPLTGPKQSFETRGSLDGWIKGVSEIALTNSRLAFALSTGFAGPTLDILGEPSGGFHLIGKSSTGKSTLLLAAASIWSSPLGFIRTWRSTSNGLESLASNLNDNLLILDELSQCDPREAGLVAYMLANGQGKTRADRLGLSKPIHTWRLLFLSTGEENLSSLISSIGRTTKAGQEIRLAEFDADAGKSLGVFDSHEGFSSPAALARSLSVSTSQNHGIVGQKWVEYLVKNYRAAQKILFDGVNDFIRRTLEPGHSAQKGRVAHRFAVVASAGELATEAGLTGWPKGVALEGCIKCFESWNERFGDPQREEQIIKQAVRTFFEKHGASRFDDISSPNDRVIPNRAGFYRLESDGGREYRVFTDVFRQEMCMGLDYRSSEKYLCSIGWLKTDGSCARPKERLPGFKNPTRVYVFTGKVWSDDF